MGILIFCLLAILIIVDGRQRGWGVLRTVGTLVAVWAVLTVVDFFIPLEALLVPLAVCLGIAVALFLLLLMLGSDGGSAVSNGMRSSGQPREPGFREIEDGYGKRLGTLSMRNGEIKDSYGNRKGWINTHSGEVEDRYGNRTGWID